MTTCGYVKKNLRVRFADFQIDKLFLLTLIYLSNLIDVLWLAVTMPEMQSDN